MRRMTSSLSSHRQHDKQHNISKPHSLTDPAKALHHGDCQNVCCCLWFCLLCAQRPSFLPTGCDSSDGIPIPLRVYIEGLDHNETANYTVESIRNEWGGGESHKGKESRRPVTQQHALQYFADGTSGSPIASVTKRTGRFVFHCHDWVFLPGTRGIFKDIGLPNRIFDANAGR